MFRDFMCDCDYDPDDTCLKPQNAVGIGNLSGKLVLECRMGDGSNPHATLHKESFSDFTGYHSINPPVPQPIKHIDRWQPLLRDTTPQQFVTPHWGIVKPFALKWGGQFRPPSPLECDDTEFKKQTEILLDYSANLTDEQKVIAEFWGGMHEDKFVDTSNSEKSPWASPPEQICRLARYLSRKYRYKNANDIKLFFSLSNALLDASIAAWDCKVHYDYIRPQSLINLIYRGELVKAWGGPGEGIKEVEGEKWMPYLPTPPFAEYVSGHSTFCAAADEILYSFCCTRDYGESIIIPKGGSKIEPGCTPSEDITLTWSTLKDAANQAGISRLYGGIHFSKGDSEGRKLGARVGCEVWEKANAYFNGELG